MSALRRNRPVRMRGVALLLVLWLVLLLAGVVAAFALSARVESTSGNGLARGVRAAQAARAGIELAVARMSDPDPQRRWTPDGSPHAFTLGDAEVVVAVRDESAKIDLNAAPLDLLARLFEQLGEPRDAATRLAGAIVDWRDPDNLTQPGGGAEDADYAAAGLEGGAKDAPFETVAEVEQVLGMRPELYARAAPHLTVHSGNARPDARFADPVVRAALGLPPVEAAAGGPLPVGGSGTYSIDSRARLTDGRSAHLSVVVRVGGNALPGSTYTPLRWQDEALSP
ncbi:general secretion pathway protein GspK [Thermomonas flagellata]|uniref:general secretion pathway protein GspK n=1 Tax=Thermomonas flagellata TaxID=2888524 RepID=UPI001F036CAD|nr:type II secretion system protein GspK [Thermomonas flagellata]